MFLKLIVTSIIYYNLYFCIISLLWIIINQSRFKNQYHMYLTLNSQNNLNIEYEFNIKKCDTKH